MVRAHSLLYSIYICLIVAVLCGALLYVSGLYNQLNVYYNTHEDLYIHNQSLVNYALANAGKETTEVPEDEATGIESVYEEKQYGMLSLLLAKSILREDTITSVHFVGKYSADKTCIYLPGYGRALSYSGKVKLVGKKYLPSSNIDPVFLDMGENSMSGSGDVLPAERMLPQCNTITFPDTGKGVALNSVIKTNDSVYFNSFFKPVININVPGNTLSNVIIKGNFVLTASDSLYIRKSTVMEDVIIVASKIAFEDGFKGNVQAFARESISLGKDVALNYPSVLCISNTTTNKSRLYINENCSVQGNVLLYGNDFLHIDDNSIEIGKGSVILGDIYCSGALTLFGNVYGSVYTNKFLHKTDTGRYENCIANAEINVDKRPDYFIGVPLFHNNSTRYGILKKVW